MKKKFLMLILSTAMVLAMMPTIAFSTTESAEPTPPTGSVLVKDGFYQSASTYNASTDFYITNINGFKYFRDFVNGDDPDYENNGTEGFEKFDYTNNIFTGKTVHLLCDIDLNNEEFKPIGFHDKGKDANYAPKYDKAHFYGNFYGENHTIKNLKITCNTTQSKVIYSGLFGYITSQSTIKDLTIQNANIKGYRYVSAFVANAGSNMTFDNCKLIGTNTITGNAYVGGIVGHAANTTIKDCQAEANISASYAAGSIIGYMGGGTMNDSLAHKSTIDADEWAGGLIGFGDKLYVKDCTVKKCSIAPTSTKESVGYAIGMADETNYSTVDNASVSDSTLKNKDLITKVGDIYTSNYEAIVGKDIVYETGTYSLGGKIKGGIFQRIPEELISDGYFKIDNEDEATKAEYPYTIGKIYVAQIGETKYETVKAAVEAAKDGDTITILKDSTIASAITVDKKITINLNNTTTTFVKNGFAIEDGSLTLDGKGTVKTNIEDLDNYYAGISIKGSTESTASNYSCLTIKENVKIVSGGYGFSIKNNNGCGYGIVVDVYGRIESPWGTTINGGINKTTGNVPIIHFYEGSYNNGLYAAGYAKWILEGDQIAMEDGDYSVSGLSIKCGDFQIKSGTYKGVGPYANPTGAQYSASEETGAAVSITTNDSYAKKTNVVISGGTFESDNGPALYEGIALKKDKTPAASESAAVISVTGGQFKSKSGQDSIVILQASNKKVISDGFFSSEPKEEYLVDGYSAIHNDGKIISKIIYPWTIGHKVVFNSNGGSAVDTQELRHFDYVTVPKNPTRDNCTFAGWFNGNEQFLFDSTPITKNVTLKANWVDYSKTEGDLIVEKKDNPTIQSTAKINKTAIPLTEAEINAINASDENEIKVVLDVEKVVTPKSEAPQLDEDLIQETIKDNRLKHGTYLDITMMKALYINGEKQGDGIEVHETLEPVQITVVVPENLRQNGRTYSIIRCHEGETEILFKGKANDKWELTFDTDKFSTYAIAYSDSVIDTGDTSMLVMYAGVALLTLLGIAVMLLKKRVTNK